jgi:organic hydroperoxide reductase OsmC/OhrA
MEQDFSIALDWKRGYEFSVDFEREGVPPLLTDEPPPLGGGGGPNPARLLAAAIGNCMSASLKYCLDRSRVELLDLRVRVRGSIVRNEQGRFRVGSMQVLLEPTLAGEDVARIGRCLEIFEDFCIVGQSVRQGIDLSVEVAPRAGVPAGVAAGGDPAPVGR